MRREAQKVGQRVTSVKNKLSKNGVDGTPKATATRVDAHDQMPEEDRANFALELDEEKKTSPSHAEMFSATEIMQKQLLHQMQCLCVSVQDMRARMEGRFAEEGQKRRQENLLLKTEIQQENQLLKTEMCTRMDAGLKKEESARQMVQNDLVTMKEEIRQIELEVVPRAVMPARLWKKDQEELSLDHRQALVTVITISVGQER